MLTNSGSCVGAKASFPPIWHSVCLTWPMTYPEHGLPGTFYGECSAGMPGNHLPRCLMRWSGSVANINRKLVHFSARKYPPRLNGCCRARSSTQRIRRSSRIFLATQCAAEVSLSTCTPAHSAICTDFCSYSTPKHADCSRWICQPIATAMRSPGLAAWFAVHSTAPPIRE